MRCRDLNIKKQENKYYNIYKYSVPGTQQQVLDQCLVLIAQQYLACSTHYVYSSHHVCVHSLCSQSLIREDLNQLSVIPTNPAILMNNSTQRINLQTFCYVEGYLRRN